MKIFAVSDIHSFYDELIEALDEAGFDRNNPNHLLVCCGDYLDRGPKSWDVIDFLSHLHNVVLVRGNHEDLMEEMIDRGYAHSHDIHNGTYQSFLQLFPYVENKVNQKRFYKQMSPEMKAVHELILKPFYSKMVNYFETEHYVFCHGYIPDKKDWRTGNWYESRWVNGIETHHFMRKNNRLNTDKTIVCGHWHCSWGWSHLAQKYKEFPQKTHEDFEKAFQPYREPGLIAIDACTAYSGKVNVVVLEDNLLEESK